jgi:plasmid stabilization system protein ParE
MASTVPFIFRQARSQTLPFSMQNLEVVARLVILTLRAQRDLAQLFDHINARNSEAALNWARGLRGVFRTLKEQPNRCPVTPESNALRHLHYGDKPNVCRVMERQKRVKVLHIRHGARRRFNVGRSA